MCSERWRDGCPCRTRVCAGALGTLGTLHPRRCGGSRVGSLTPRPLSPLARWSRSKRQDTVYLCEAVLPLSPPSPLGSAGVTKLQRDGGEQGARALGCRPRPRPRLPWPPCCARALARSRPGVRTACHSRRATEPCASASPSMTRLSQPCLPRQLAAMVKGGSPMTLSLESV